MLDEVTVRTRIAELLKRARHTPRLQATASGVGDRIIERLEAARNRFIELSHLYLLARHYDVSLGRLLDLREPLGRWPTDAPSLPETDAAVRRLVRDARLSFDIGTPRLAELISVQQSWIVRFEGGQAPRTDCVRIVRIALALDLQPSDLLPAAFSRGSDE